jgi:anaphase-promoting complex subunit 11
MKIVYKEYHPVASWRWDVDPDGGNRGPNVEDPQKMDDGILDEPGLVGDDGPANADDEDEDDDDEEMCGVCQQEFESACPACKVPGDDCPLSKFPLSPNS